MKKLLATTGIIAAIISLTGCQATITKQQELQEDQKISALVEKGVTPDFIRKEKTPGILLKKQKNQTCGIQKYAEEEVEPLSGQTERHIYYAIRSSKIFFENNSSSLDELLPKGYGLCFAQSAQLLYEEYGGMCKFHVVGSASTIGNSEKNLDLGLRRAKALETFLDLPTWELFKKHPEAYKGQLSTGEKSPTQRPARKERGGETTEAEQSSRTAFMIAHCGQLQQ